MERRKTATFENDSILVNCYGDEASVSKLESFWESQQGFDLSDLVSEIGIMMLMNRIEGFAVGKDPAGEDAAQAMNSQLAGVRLLIGGGKFSLVAFFWNPDFCAKRLGLDDAKKAKMMDALKSIYYPNEDFDWREI